MERHYLLDTLQNHDIKARRLYSLIQDVLEDQQDTNLGSRVGRETLAKRITQLYFDFDSTTADYIMEGN